MVVMKKPVMDIVVLQTRGSGWPVAGPKYNYYIIDIFIVSANNVDFQAVRLSTTFLNPTNVCGRWAKTIMYAHFIIVDMGV